MAKSLQRENLSWCKSNCSESNSEGEIDSQAFTDVNQAARPGSEEKVDQLTLIADRVNTK